MATHIEDFVLPNGVIKLKGFLVTMSVHRSINSTATSTAWVHTHMAENHERAQGMQEFKTFSFLETTVMSKREDKKIAMCYGKMPS